MSPEGGDFQKLLAGYYRLHSGEARSEEAPPAETIVTCPSCGSTSMLADAPETKVVQCASCASEAPMEEATAAAAVPPTTITPPIQRREKMRLRDAMLDDAAPTTETTSTRSTVSGKKSRFGRKSRKENLTEAASSYQFADERKTFTARMLVVSAACSSAILAVQYLFVGDPVIQSRIAQGYLFAYPIFSLALLLAAFASSIQRFVVLLILPACWMMLSTTAAPSQFLDYILIFTVVAYFVYIIEFVIRGMESFVFRVFCITYLATFLTQLYFIGGDSKAMASLAKFPLLKKVMEPTLQTLNLLHSMIN
jgi:hypothetical protein